MTFKCDFLCPTLLKYELHGPSMLTNRPILVSVLKSIHLLSILRKHLVIGHFSFSLFFIGHHTGSKLILTTKTGLIFRLDQIVPCSGPCIAATAASAHCLDKVKISRTLSKGLGAMKWT